MKICLFYYIITLVGALLFTLLNTFVYNYVVQLLSLHVVPIIAPVSYTHLGLLLAVKLEMYNGLLAGKLEKLMEMLKKIDSDCKNRILSMLGQKLRFPLYHEQTNSVEIGSVKDLTHFP